jgi:hypothetical protein
MTLHMDPSLLPTTEPMSSPSCPLSIILKFQSLEHYPYNRERNRTVRRHEVKKKKVQWRQVLKGDVEGANPCHFFLWFHGILYLIIWYSLQIFPSTNTYKHDWWPGWELPENIPTGRSLWANAHSKDHTQDTKVNIHPIYTSALNKVINQLQYQVIELQEKILPLDIVFGVWYEYHDIGGGGDLHICSSNYAELHCSHSC